MFVKVGDEVNTGDVLFVLEEDDSEELKNAQDNLLQLEASYKKSLISISNDNAKENYEIAKARKEYDETAAVYKLYSDKDASVIIREENEAKVKLNKLRNEYEDAERQWETAKDESDYLDAVEDVEEYIRYVQKILKIIDLDQFDTYFFDSSANNMKLLHITIHKDKEHELEIAEL